MPQGHPDYDEVREKVLRILGNLYGLKEAPLLWWRHFQLAILKYTDLRQMRYGEYGICESHLILLVYVNGLLFLGENNVIQEILRVLWKHFNRIEYGFLEGMLTKGELGNFVLSQRAYIEKTLAKYYFNVLIKPLPLLLDL